MIIFLLEISVSKNLAKLDGKGTTEAEKRENSQKKEQKGEKIKFNWYFAELRLG